MTHLIDIVTTLVKSCVQITSIIQRMTKKEKGMFETKKSNELSRVAKLIFIHNLFTIER